jgi:putative hydrolase of the HAD superfamily
MKSSPLDQMPRLTLDRSAIKTILFDFGGTLDADGVAWKERFHRLYREEGVDIPNERFAQAFYKADDALVGSIPSTLSLTDTVHRLTRDVARELDVRDQVLVGRIAQRFLADAHERFTVNRHVLQDLTRHYRLGIVSNFYGNLSAVCREAGLDEYFQTIIDSEVVGHLKPSPEIFHAALNDLQVAPQQAVFVGDSLYRDMGGARSIGMAHVWLTSQATYEGETCCPNDPVAHGLEEVRALFV